MSKKRFIIHACMGPPEHEEVYHETEDIEKAFKLLMHNASGKLCLALIWDRNKELLGSGTPHKGYGFILHWRDTPLSKVSL